MSSIKKIQKSLLCVFNSSKPVSQTILTHIQRKLQAFNLSQKEKLGLAEKADSQINDLKKQAAKTRAEKEDLALLLETAEKESKELRSELLNKIGASDYMKKVCKVIITCN